MKNHLKEKLRQSKYNMINIILDFYKQYTDNDKYVFYKEHDIVIIFEITGNIAEISINSDIKKYYSDALTVVLLFDINDPYKLVTEIGKYIMNDTVASYCYRNIEDAYNLFQRYHHTGEKMSDVFIKGDYNSENYSLNGFCQFWYVTGKLFSEGNMCGGNKKGMWKQWYANGNINVECFYNGSKNGIYKQWHQNGNIYEEGYYVNDKKKGVWKYWKQSGQFDKEITY